jgi:hypothetical protein
LIAKQPNKSLQNRKTYGTAKQETWNLGRS